MRVLIDTNLLLRLVEPSAPRQGVANQAILRQESVGNEIVLVPQCLFEFWAVATRTRTANGLGYTVDSAKLLVEKFGREIRLLPDTPDLADRWFDLVTQHNVTGVNSHDARLAAAMLTHGVTHLLTFNARDFRRYGHISLIDP